MSELTITKAFPRDAHDELNDRHARNPQPGDYWHECFSPACVVLGVTAGMVVLCRTTKEVDQRHWTWDLDVVEARTLQEFHDWLEYDTIPGHYWARVSPGAHLWAVVAAKELTACTTKP